MARQPRIEFPGAFYHVMSRGDRREPIFETTTTGACFYAPPTECCEKGGWRIYAWVLRSNHYHWVLQTPEANLVAGMKWFQNTYTRRLNSRRQKWGHVFGGRYKAVLVDASGGGYLETLIDYWNRNLNNNITVTDSEAYLNPQREFQAQQRHNEIMYQMQQDRIQRIRAEHDAIL